MPGKRRGNQGQLQLVICTPRRMEGYSITLETTGSGRAFQREKEITVWVLVFHGMAAREVNWKLWRDRLVRKIFFFNQPGPDISIGDNSPQAFIQRYYQCCDYAGACPHLNFCHFAFSFTSLPWSPLVSPLLGFAFGKQEGMFAKPSMINETW